MTTIENTRRGRRPPAGFTLVELLVAIGVIGLLMTILLPTLSKVRESAKRVQCLSNLRQVHVTLTIYAQRNADAVPVGYRVGRKQWNSMVFSSTSKKYCLFGVLYLDGLMKDPAVFFCPADNDPRSMLNTETNPWPPGDPAKQVYAGYGFRPEHQLVDDLQATPGAFAPKLQSFRNRALLADLTAMPDRLDLRHVRGVNVLYNDGSGAWVDRSQFRDPLEACTAIDPAANPHQDAIWKVFDEQR